MKDISISLFSLFRRSKSNNSARKDIELFFGSPHAFFVNSGRAALYLILKTFMDSHGAAKKEVIIPAYTCFSVPASIVKAGLKIRLVEINRTTLDYDYSRLENEDFENVLAVVSSNLFGLTGDYNKITSIAKHHDVRVIDDAAQSAGIRYNGKMSGTLGDAGFTSLGRGKNLSIYSGGVLLTNSDSIGERIEGMIEKYDDTGLGADLFGILKMMVYSIFLKPSAYWIPASLPFLGLGKTTFDPEFTAGKLTNSQISTLRAAILKLENHNNRRAEIASRLAEKISRLDSYFIPGYGKGDCPSYLRLPVLAKSRKSRDRIIEELARQGISSSYMYPSTIAEIPGIKPWLAGNENDYPGAIDLADKLFTLPTHSYVSARDIEKIASILESNT